MLYVLCVFCVLLLLLYMSVLKAHYSLCWNVLQVPTLNIALELEVLGSFRFSQIELDTVDPFIPLRPCTGYW